MSSTGEIIGGLIIPVVAGILNGSWNAAFSPAANLAVGPARMTSETQEDKSTDLCHHHAWVLFQFYAAIANIILCLFWAGGPSRVEYIVSEASTTSVVLVSVFGVLMGTGITLFGEACRIAGVGMGTNLTIGIILILGTILPLGLNSQIATPSGGMIITGLVVSSVGLFFSMKSLQIRTMEDMEKVRNKSDQTEKDEEFAKSDTLEKEEVVSDSQPATHSPLTKIIICTFAAVLSSTLQFAFVFGDELIDIAASEDGPGSTPESGLTAIIWLFVIPLSTIPNIIFGLYQARHDPIENMWRCPPSRHLKIFTCACLPWIGHINLYGVAANLLLPAHLAAAVAWPILMMTTVAWGMILSIYLGEWKEASTNAQKKQKIGLGLMLLGVVVVMASVALD